VFRLKKDLGQSPVQSLAHGWSALMSDQAAWVFIQLGLQI